MDKISFDDKHDLTKATIEGWKKMTLRIVPKGLMEEAHAYAHRVHGDGHDMKDYLLENARYKVGQIVAIAECYRTLYRNGKLPFHNGASLDKYIDMAGWGNKMFVKASLMPNKIRFTNVRVELLQDITDEDCLKEGIISKTLCPPGDITYYYVPGMPVRSKRDIFPTPRDAFATLIDKISGKGTWENNPWVYVYEYELVRSAVPTNGLSIAYAVMDERPDKQTIRRDCAKKE